MSIDYPSIAYRREQDKGIHLIWGIVLDSNLQSTVDLLWKQVNEQVDLFF